MATKRVTFSEIPVGEALYCYWNLSKPLDCDTFYAIKTSETHVHAPGQFDTLEVPPNAPCRAITH